MIQKIIFQKKKRIIQCYEWKIKCSNGIKEEENGNDLFNDLFSKRDRKWVAMTELR